jgi:hypothetical protein
VTYDGSTFRLYRDGQLDKTVTISATYANTTLPLNFGRFATGNVGWFYQGVMDDIRRYNRALDSSEINALANPSPAPILGTSGGDPPRLTFIQIQPGGHVIVQGAGSPNFSYRLEASSNLVDWTQIGAAEADDSGAFELTDPEGQLPSRFYRVRTP